MLDLNELERRLDEALAVETEESLNEWLLNQRRNESNYPKIRCLEYQAGNSSFYFIFPTCNDSKY